ncbi:MAG TPA: ABC transporter permease [Gaiellaceae bacterium]|nr:ABC transporter permease [Gaiellaceae bacterium]
MGDAAGSREPHRDVGATYGTAATEYAADRAVQAPAQPGIEGETGGRSQFQLALRRFIHHRMALVGLTIFVSLVAVAFIVPHFWKWGYAEITPEFSTAPSLDHPFGTDTIGHDLFAQVLVATQTSLKSAFIVTVIATLFGTVIGALAGYYGKLADATLMRFTDLVLTVPLLALLLVLANVLSKQSSNYLYIAIIIAAVLWTYLARLVRGTFLSLREHDYVIAARAIGARDRRIIFRHMIPNAMGPIVVNATLTVANAILIESALSFLGLGIQPPEVSLGSLINNGQGSATTEWWLFAFPSATLVLIILAVNFVGDGLRDALDPRQTRVRA